MYTKLVEKAPRSETNRTKKLKIRIKINIRNKIVKVE